MPDDHRRFLVSFKRGEPDWGLLGLPKVEALPAIKFRQQKLASMPIEHREAQIQNLIQALFPPRL